jgi:fatty-acyl-CoA synthase
MSVGDQLSAVKALAEAGLLRPVRPDKLLRMGLAYRRFGASFATGYQVQAIRRPDTTAVIDELGSLTFAEIDRRTNALAHALSDRGVVEGDGVAIMCRNHRGFIEATVASSKLGADALYLNTSFAGPQLTDVVKRENPRALIFDEEFADLVRDAGRRRKRFVAWTDGEADLKDPTLEELTAEGDPEPVVAPSEVGKAVILTSGTTGTPKGASRPTPSSLGPAAALFSKIPLHAEESTMIAAPLFHAWGFSHLAGAMGLGSTVVLRRRFDPEGTLSATAQHSCTALILVPVMLQRILELPAQVIDRYDLSSLRVIALSGSALSASLAERALERFGDVIYNLYGSTEVAWAAIATPEDMHAAPGTVGKPPLGTVVRIYDEHGSELPPGETGRIFVGNEMLFEGYTGGGSKDRIGDLMATGDVGHFDEEARLFVDGRDDEMIVSGGENVFPQEVEELLARHSAVADVAVVGVEDEKFGQRLRAVIVKRNGAQLSEKDVKDYVKSNLANYKVPRDVIFVDELPRTSTGKVLKRELREA